MFTLKSVRSGKNKYEMVTDYNNEDIDHEFIDKAQLSSPFCLWTSKFTLFLIGIYYIPSICLTFYQRWLNKNFHFPLMTVLVHMIVKYLLATLIRVLLIKKQRKSRILMGWKEYIISVAPIGIFSGLDIGLSNWGLELVQISLYTVTKSTTIIFILAFSILFKLEKKAWRLCFIVFMIAIGLILFTYKATEFNFLGFILLLIASMTSGLRWTCAQLLLQKSKCGMRNPVDMIYHMQPLMIISILPLAIYMESSTFVKSCQLFRFTDHSVFLYTLFKILIGAFIAFFMEMMEVMVITYTSSLTLSIAGIFKEVISVFLAVEWNGDQISLINLIGLVICLGGITCHTIHKLKTSPPMVEVPTEFNQRRRYYETDHIELNKNLIDQNNTDLDSDGELSDSQILFDILNSHDR